MPQERLNSIFFGALLTLLLGTMAFVGQQVYSHEERITRLEERLPADTRDRLVRIESKLDALKTVTDGTANKGANTHRYRASDR